MSLLDKATAGLGVARWQRALVMVCVVAVLASVGGFLIGQRWERGTQALADNKQLRDDIAAQSKRMKELHENAEALRANGVSVVQDFRTAARRMNAIAQEYENDQVKQSEFYKRQQRQWVALGLDDPDLRKLRMGERVLKHWNQSNAGAGADSTAPATTGNISEPDAAVSEPDSGTGRLRADPDRKPRPDSESIPRLQRWQGALDIGSAGIPINGTELVLRRPAATRYPKRNVY